MVLNHCDLLDSVAHWGRFMMVMSYLWIDICLFDLLRILPFTKSGKRRFIALFNKLEANWRFCNKKINHEYIVGLPYHIEMHRI